jgi:hypothetical protein
MSAASVPQALAASTAAEAAANGKEQSCGISILKEVFPEHGSTMQKAPVLEQLLGDIATPARAQGAHARYNAKPLPAAVPPPPAMPPSMPVAHCQAQWQAPSLAPVTPPGPMFGSYRERLRAGGRNAFQRSIDVGLMPKAMKQEWNPTSSASAASQGFFPQQPYTGMEDAQQQMWNVGTGQQNASACWEYSWDQSQMPMQPPFPQDVPLMQQSQQMMPLIQQPTPQVPTMLPDQCMQKQLPPMELAQSPMAQMQMPVSGESTPTDIDRCMSIVMPQSAQFPCNNDLVAAQLKAAAADQCYED